MSRHRVMHAANLVALLLSSALLSQPALAQERVIGLLALPEVFGGGPCDRFTPRPLELRATPQGPVVGTVLVVKPWTHHSNGGCEGLEVGVRAPRAATVQQLPTMEYAYEEPGAVVLERRGKWFRVRLSDGSAWLEASAQDEFYGLEQLFEDSLTYLTEAWSGQVAASPGSAGRPAKLPRRAADQPVRVRRASREKEGLWFFVDIMSHACEGDGEPTVVDQGWVPAYGKADAPTIWFHSRGC
jgi:hypothetical protein